MHPRVIRVSFGPRASHLRLLELLLLRLQLVLCCCLIEAQALRLFRCRLQLLPHGHHLQIGR